MAETPQQTIRELKDLIVAYAKQEAVEPLQGLGRYIGFGLAGGTLLGAGVMFLAIGVLRLLQDEVFSPENVSYSWTWVPYLIVVVGMLVIAAIAWWARGRQAARQAMRQAKGEVTKGTTT